MIGGVLEKTKGLGLKGPDRFFERLGIFPEKKFYLIFRKISELHQGAVKGLGVLFRVTKGRQSVASRVVSDDQRQTRAGGVAGRRKSQGEEKKKDKPQCAFHEDPSLTFDKR